MDTEKELIFMRAMLTGLNIRTRMWPEDREEIDSFDLGIRRYVDPGQQYLAYIKEYSTYTEEHVLYDLRDAFGWNYLHFMHPGNGSDFMLIGPFFSERPERKWVLGRAEHFGIEQSRLDGFLGFYDKVPVVHDREMLLNLIKTYLYMLWGEKAFTMKPVRTIEGPRTEDGTLRMHGDVLSMTEKNYKAENELMSAVMAGDSMKVGDMLRRFDFSKMSQRTSDPVRNLKNYAVIMNTLLRKAAEKGNVHPVYLDRVSGVFAREIEDARTAGGVERILRKMPLKYVSLVQTEGKENLSPVIRRSMTITALNIGKSLSLSILAKEVGVTPSYLSRLWRKETGETVTEYIRKEKMKNAQQLLSYTDLRIGTVAEMTGYPDVCYFSRIFKKETGKTPTEARNAGYGRLL